MAELHGGGVLEYPYGVIQDALDLGDGIGGGIVINRLVIFYYGLVFTKLFTT